jgi:hypothetical protein
MFFSCLVYIYKLPLRLYHVYLVYKYIHKTLHINFPLFPAPFWAPFSCVFSLFWMTISLLKLTSFIFFLLRRSSILCKPLWIYENHVSQRFMSSIVFTEKDSNKLITCPRSTTLALPFVFEPTIQGYLHDFVLHGYVYIHTHTMTPVMTNERIRIFA